MFLRRPTFLLRFAVCLLAVLQGVAVSWHICDLGAPHGGPAHCQTGGAIAAHRASAPQCHEQDDPTRAWRMVVDEIPQQDGETHCLAALLSTTPAQTARPFAFSSSFTARDLVRESAASHLCEAVTFESTPRGPPVFS